MESSEKGEQFPFKEIVTLLAKKNLKSDPFGIPSKILLKLSLDSPQSKFWVWMIPNNEKLELFGNQCIAIKLEPILVDFLEQNVFVFNIPDFDPELPGKFIKKTSRKPGPNLRPH